MLQDIDRSNNDWCSFDQSFDNSGKQSSHSSSSSSSSYDDTIGAYQGKIGEIIAHNYEIIKELGVGTFGRVLLCKDIKFDGKEYAIKIVRNVKKYTDSARIEAEIIEHIQAIKDGRANSGYVGQKEFLKAKKENKELRIIGKSISNEKNYCVKMYKWFEWNNHMCIVFENLGPCLLDILKMNNYTPFGMGVIKTIGYQISTALKFLHDECGIIHTDLKLENILFINNDSKLVVPDKCDSPWRCEEPEDKKKKRLDKLHIPSDIMCEARLIDFGGATYFDERGETGYYKGLNNFSDVSISSNEKQKIKTSIINTRQYRSPEVIFQLGWSFPSDIWSLGCILMELFTGDLLFNTHDNSEHVALINKIVGPIPDYLAKDAACIRDNYEFFTSDGCLMWPKPTTSKESKQFVEDAMSLGQIIWGGNNHGHPYARSKYFSQFSDENKKIYSQFYDVVSSMLQIDPNKRITALELLQHDFFKSLA